MQKIVTNLWFDTNAEEAVRFYISIFKNSKILDILLYGEAGPGPAGTVLTMTFELDGQLFTAINGGPQFKFTEAISLLVNCESQDEVDYFWDKLSEGGEKGPCGWLKDKYGLSWQVSPIELEAMMKDPDPNKAQRVTQAMLMMGKLDIAALKRAYQGEIVSLDNLLTKLSKPAQRAIQNEGIQTIAQLAGYSEKEFLDLHGIGKNAFSLAKEYLRANGLDFATK